MGATLVSALMAVIMLSISTFYPSSLLSVEFPQIAFFFFFGLVLLFSSLPWRWIAPISTQKGAYAISNSAAKSCTSDRCIGLYLFGIYIVCFLAIGLISIDSIPTLYRFAYALVSVGILLDCVKKIYKRLQYRSSPQGLVEWILELMEAGENRGNREFLLEAFESTFSIALGFLKTGDTASLKMFCSKIGDNLDFWVRLSVQLPGSLPGPNMEASLLDSYTVVEAMVAKRISSIVREALQSENLIGLETLIWFEGKFVLALHRRHFSLGYLLLYSLALSLQTEGKIDRTSREIEYITMLSEVIKAYIDRTVATQVSDRVSIFKALSLLESHLKESFRMDRKMNPAFLMQPFAEIGQLVSEEKYASIPDRADILAELRRLLSQFAAVENVRSQMDVEGTDTKSSYHEDKPFLLPVT